MKDFLSIADLDRPTIEEIFDISHQLKYVPSQHRPLDGKTLVLLFEKSSTRTRASFQIGMYHLGGKAIYLSATDSQIGRGESIMDTAKVLSRYADATVIRTYDHTRLLEYAKFADHSVINGLSDLLHPCQVLADIFTVKEKFDRPIEGMKICYLGDGNNMTNSFIHASVKLGFHFTVACPEGFLPDEKVMAYAREQNANVEYFSDPAEAIKDSDVVILMFGPLWILRKSLKKKASLEMTTLNVKRKSANKYLCLIR